MKAKVDGLFEFEIDENDYSAIQKVANIEIVQLISNQIGFWRWKNLAKMNNKFQEECIKRNLDPKKVAPKFLIPFLEAASLDEDEDIQKIWARLLADECEKEGSVSLRTIGVLKNMCKGEALLFEKIVGDAVDIQGDAILFRHDENSVDDIIKMVDCGLVVSDTNMKDFQLNFRKFENSLAILSKYDETTFTVISEFLNNNFTVKIPIYPFTRAGIELLKVIGKKQSFGKYRDIMKDIQKKNQNCKMHIFNVEKKMPNGIIKFDTTNDLMRGDNE